MAAVDPPQVARAAGEGIVGQDRASELVPTSGSKRREGGERRAIDLVRTWLLY
jgi:hypothetical protein